MTLRRLNAEGIRQFRVFLCQLKIDSKMPIPMWLLQDSATSEFIANVEIRQPAFGSRLAIAAFLDQVLARAQLTSVDQDAGLWAWLSLYYFDQICPSSKSRGRSVKAISSYIPNLDSQRRFYRHLLLGPWLIYRFHRDCPDRLLGILSSPVDVATSETYRLFVEIPSLISCRAAVAVATLLYFDAEAKAMKRRSGSKDKGGCRRLVEFLQQLDCTYDLMAMDVDSLVRLLPQEFHSFVPKQLTLQFDTPKG